MKLFRRGLFGRSRRRCKNNTKFNLDGEIGEFVMLRNGLSGTVICPVENYINIHCIMQDTGYTTLRNEFLGEQSWLDINYHQAFS